MAKYSVTPWRTQADLLQVREQLYSSNAEKGELQRRAVSRIMAWKLRGNLPHAVESTALLVDAILHHNPAINSTFSIRAVYSAAFCRFVTGFCDIGRHRERALEPSSMLEIAKQIGMPSEFVALRHEATHEELPGLQRLMNATQKALDWLWSVYWSRIDIEEDAEGTDEGDAALTHEIGVTLRGYRKATRDGLLAKQQRNDEQSLYAQRAYEALLAICPNSHRLTSVVAKILVEDRLLFPADRDLNSPLDGSYLLWDKLVAAFQLRSSSNFVHKLEMALLRDLAKSAIHRPDSDPQKQALAEWALHLINLSNVLITGYGGLLANDAMKQCCLHSGFWTRKVGTKLLAMGDGAFRDQWSELFGASQVADDANGPVPGVREEQRDGRGGIGLGIVTASLDDGSTGGEQADSWTRSILPPSAPIGVVRS